MSVNGAIAVDACLSPQHMSQRSPRGVTVHETRRVTKCATRLDLEMPLPSPSLPKPRSVLVGGDQQQQLFAHALATDGGRDGRTAPIKQLTLAAVPPRQIRPPNTHSVRNKAATHNTGRLAASRGGAHAPPAKRRKLAGHAQTTLDQHFFPAVVTPSQPHTQQGATRTRGHASGTLKGGRAAIDTVNDGLLKPAPKTAPKPTHRVSRSPAPTPGENKPEDKRTLRSQDDGPRLKSELSIYFPNYEEIIFDAAKDDEFITVDSSLYVTDDVQKQVDTNKASPGKSTSKRGKSNSVHKRGPSINGTSMPLTPRRTASNSFNGSPSLNLDFVANNISDNPDDPLTDAHFFKSHRRAERRERQLRNIEREHAMHEKVQLDRILEGLKGHDWLRVLGITGITDGEAKKFEPKRDYFIEEVRTLIEKFKEWKEEEKRQRDKREAFVAAKEAESDDESPEGSVEPPSSDLNASASRQLQQESLRASKAAAKLAAKGKERAVDPLEDTPSVPRQQNLPPSPEMPMTSFYAKPHLRDAALGKSRHGRSVTAFGRPVPEMDEREFHLPSEYLTEDTLRANARERRRRKRESVANASTT